MLLIVSDPDERMQNLEGKVLDLEDKVIDLESDNKGLMDDRDKLAMEKDGLLEQISVRFVLYIYIYKGR